MTVAPDGRVFVCEEKGRLRVIKNGALLPKAFVTVKVSRTASAACSAWRSTRISRRTATSTSTTRRASRSAHNRFSRFTAKGDVAVRAAKRSCSSFPL